MSDSHFSIEHRTNVFEYTVPPTKSILEFARRVCNEFDQQLGKTRVEEEVVDDFAEFLDALYTIYVKQLNQDSHPT